MVQWLSSVTLPAPSSLMSGAVELAVYAVSKKSSRLRSVIGLRLATPNAGYVSRSVGASGIRLESLMVTLAIGRRFTMGV